MTAPVIDGDLEAEVRTMNREQLAALGDSALGDLARAELRRRDELDQARQRRRNDPVAQEWRLAAWAQFEAAEAATNGYMLNSRGIAAGISPWSLWSGPMWQAERWASWELLRFWETSPRCTVTDYRAQTRRDREAEVNDQLDRDECDAVRPGASADVESEGSRADGRRDVVPGPAARAQAQAGPPGARADAGRRAPVRPGPVMMPIRLTAEHPVTVIHGPASAPALASQPAAADELEAAKARLREIVQRRNAERAAGQCRHPERPGNGKPLCGDCPDGPAQRSAAPAMPAGPVTFPGPASSGTVAVRESGAVAQARRSADGAEVLDYTRRLLGHFAVWPSPAALDCITAWVGHAHARGADGMLTWQSSPRLLFSSAEPGSGKSHAMRLAARLCPAPAIFTEPSEPAVAHAIGREHATLALDEVDLLFGRGARKAAIRAVVQDGYTPDGSWARVRGGKVDRIPTFGALMMAGLDSLETSTDGQLKALMTRCIRLRMTRAPEGYRPPRWDNNARFAATAISARLAAWGASVLTGLGDDVPDVPDGIGNRQAELWEPLILTADAAGPEWGDRIRAACEELTMAGAVPDEDETTISQLDEILAGW